MSVPVHEPGSALITRPRLMSPPRSPESFQIPAAELPWPPLPPHIRPLIERKPVLDSTASNTRSRLHEAANLSITHLYNAIAQIDIATSQVGKHGSPLLDKTTGEQTAFRRRHGYAVLLGLPLPLTLGLIEGKLHKVPDYMSHIPEQDPGRPVQHATTAEPPYLTRSKAHKENRPSIYVHTLVNRRGDWLTKGQVNRLLEAVELYIEPCVDYFASDLRDPIIVHSQRSIDFAKKVDVMKLSAERDSRYRPDKVPNGARKYLHNIEHVHHARGWIRQTRMSLQLPDMQALRDDEMMPYTFTETGFSVDPVEQIDKHRKHKSSVPLMNLVEAICSFLFCDSNVPTSHQQDKVFFMQAHIVYECGDNHEAVMAKHIISTLVHSYTWLGGFNSTLSETTLQSAENCPAWAYTFWQERKDVDLMQNRFEKEKIRIQDEIDMMNRYNATVARQKQATDALHELRSLEAKIGRVIADIESHDTSVIENSEKLTRIIEDEMIAHRELKILSSEQDRMIEAWQTFEREAGPLMRHIQEELIKRGLLQRDPEEGEAMEE